MLDAIPLVLIVVGLAAYAVLAGADFGAGIWILTSRQDDFGQRIRAHARHAMGPVWEANHVWLIFVLVVCWTAYPSVLASVGSSLSIPLFLALIGIALRGTAYALRGQTERASEASVIERVFGISSVITPFALGACVGGIASGRIPVGNALGSLASSWLNPTSLVTAILSVAICAYLAAVYLAADAQRLADKDLVVAFRTRALLAGVLAGCLAIIALLVVHSDAPHLWHGLTHGLGLVALGVSALSGVSTLLLVLARRFETARITGAAAVASLICGWPLAQRPDLLPGLTLHSAVAGRSTIVALLITIGGGLLVLVPALMLLFGLVLGGRFDNPLADTTEPQGVSGHRPAGGQQLPIAIACFVVGAGLTDLVDPAWGRIIGVALLVTAVGLAIGTVADTPDDVTAIPDTQAKG